MKKVGFFVGIVLALSIFCSFAQAESEHVPSLVNYQGLLTDANGNPLVTGDYKLSFNIFKESTGGIPEWGPQTFGTVTVVNGKFNVILGPNDDEPNNRLITNAFLSEETYLEITINDGSPIAPRQQILSAPYALVANTVRGPNLFVGTNGSVGIGREAPLERLDVNGNIKTSTAFMGTGGHGSAYAHFSHPNFNGAGQYALLQHGSKGHTYLNSVGSGLLFFRNNNNTKMTLLPNGNLGIGTGSPSAKLDVAGTVKIAGWAEESLTDNSYARMGSLLIQWGTHSRSDDNKYDITFPIPFPNKCFSVTTNRQKPNAESPMCAIEITKTKFSIDREDKISGLQTVNWIAVGH